MNKPLTFKHSGNTGDIIYSLPSIKQRCIDMATKAIIYIHLDQPSTYTEASHPVGSVMMNQYMYDNLRPLLMSQPYMQDVQTYEGQQFDYDLDLFRKANLSLSGGNISLWYHTAHHDLRPNLFEKSLFVDPIANDYIIVNRTHRYNNTMINYLQLKEFDNVKFVGTEKEFKSLRLHNDKIEQLQCVDFLELARYIAGCRIFIGNQSMAFAIAEQLKVKRVLEQHYYCPNVIPQGGEYYVFHTNEQFKNILHGQNKNTDQSETPQSDRAA